MSQSLSFAIGEVSIRQQDGLFSLNDLHRASGGELRHRPVEFIRLEQTQELIRELQKGGDSHLFLNTVKGRNGGTYACRELVIAYAAWISAAFHLKVIRVFLAVAAPQTEPKQMRLDDAVRLDHAFHLASHAAAQVQRAVFNAVMAGEQPNALTSQWMLYFHTKSWGDKSTDAYCKPLANDAICLGPDAYLANLERGDGHALNIDQLARMAEFSIRKLAGRVRQQAA